MEKPQKRDSPLWEYLKTPAGLMTVGGVILCMLFTGYVTSSAVEHYNYFGQQYHQRRLYLSTDVCRNPTIRVGVEDIHGCLSHERYVAKSIHLRVLLSIFCGEDTCTAWMSNMYLLLFGVGIICILIVGYNISNFFTFKHNRLRLPRSHID